MHRRERAEEVFLKPGEHHFGNRNTRIRTLLGTCVSLTFWHPEFQLGGMCHYMLPSRSDERRHADLPEQDGRYADEAIDILLQSITAAGTSYRDYQVKVFGGGNMFPDHASGGHVGMKNVEAARRLVRRHGLNCVAEHLGGYGYRKVIFDIGSGNVWVKHEAMGCTSGNIEQERRMQCAAFA